MPPRTLEVERELMPAVGDEDIAASQGNGFAATGDPSFAVEVHAGGIHVTARACDVRAGMKCAHAAPPDARHSEASDESRLDLAAQGLGAGGLDLDRGNMTTHEICPELRTLTARDPFGRHRDHGGRSQSKHASPTSERCRREVASVPAEEFVMRTTLAALLLLTMSLWTVAMAHDRRSDEDHVRSLDDQERIAALKRDIPALERLWSEEFIVNAPNNQVVVGRRAVLETFVRAGVINFSIFERQIERI